jgi:hypothetical protein
VHLSEKPDQHFGECISIPFCPQPSRGVHGVDVQHPAWDRSFGQFHEMLSKAQKMCSASRNIFSVLLSSFLAFESKVFVFPTVIFAFETIFFVSRSLLFAFETIFFVIQSVLFASEKIFSKAQTRVNASETIISRRT